MVEGSRRTVVHRRFKIADELVRAVRIEFVGDAAAASGLDGPGRAILILDGAGAAVPPGADDFARLAQDGKRLNRDEDENDREPDGFR